MVVFSRIFIKCITAGCLCLPLVVFADIVSKEYVDRLGTSVYENYDNIQTNSAKITNLSDTINNVIFDKANAEDLAPVAFSGDYNDLTNIPDNSNPNVYEIQSNSISDAATGDSFSINMDGFIFKAIKQGSTNYWAVRILNNSGETRAISTSWLQIYNGTQGVSVSNSAFINGAEHNPDSQSGDLGYSREDTGLTYLFDQTNMHLYRWTVTVYVGKSIMVVERLH